MTKLFLFSTNADFLGMRTHSVPVAERRQRLVKIIGKGVWSCDFQA